VQPLGRAESDKARAETEKQKRVKALKGRNISARGAALGQEKLPEL